MAAALRELHFLTAGKLWDHLNKYFPSRLSDDIFIYRGHGNADWALIPTILRGESARLTRQLANRPVTCGWQAWVEFLMLQDFVLGCDEAGVSTPNDSIHFRTEHLSDSSLGGFIETPSRWPPQNLLETLAMARLHGLPTRLLDWTSHPYVAAYFAAIEALRSEWKSGQRLAIFEFNRGKHERESIGPIRVLTVRGSVSQNVVAQHGLFTVHPIKGSTDDPSEVRSLEEYLEASDSTITKLTLPIEESVKLYELCDKFKFNAVGVFPSADGASSAVLETFHFSVRRADNSAG